MPATVKSLDERMDEFARSFDEFRREYAANKASMDTHRESMAEFRGRVDVVISVLRWTSGLLVVTIIGIFSQGFSIANSAGRLEGRVDAQGARLDALTKQVEKLTDAVKEQQQEIGRVRADIAELKGLIKQK